MPRLTQTEYTRRHRAKQKARNAHLEAENLRQKDELGTLRLQLEQVQKELVKAYHYLDVFERALEVALGRPFTHTDLAAASLDTRPGLMSATLQKAFE